MRVDLSKEIQTLLLYPIEKLGFSARLLNVFRERNVDSMADLVRFKEKDFSCSRNVGKKSMKEINDFLNQYNLSWDMNI